MKKILASLCCMIGIYTYAQTPECPENRTGVIVTGEVGTTFTPTDLVDDTWADPELMQDRRVFWIHGLGGQGDDAGTTAISWFQASLWSEQEFMVNSARPDYNNISLEAAAVELKGDLESFPDADDHAIVVAHSQGGIVTRRVDQMYTTGEYGFEPRTFGGVATFGTPHQGAMIINNIDEIQAWIGDACNDLAAGPVAEFVEDHFFLDLLLGPDDYEGFTETFCGTFETQILPVIMDDYMAGTTSSYAVGAEYLEDLNAFVPEIPYICFYGVEDDPVLWNLITHLFPGREPNNTVTYGEEPFGATNDMTGVNYANAMIGKYWYKYVTYSSLYEYYNDLLTGFDMTTILCYLFPPCFPEAIAAREDAYNLLNAYARGYNWITDANLNWEQMIGARTLEEAGAYCNCTTWSEYGDLLFSTSVLVDEEDPCVPPSDYSICSRLLNYDWVMKANDGVVLRESAGHGVGQVNMGMLNKMMPGSNHFSMRNDLNTKNKLTQMYEGYHGLYYRTSHR